LDYSQAFFGALFALEFCFLPWFFLPVAGRGPASCLFGQRFFKTFLFWAVFAVDSGIELKQFSSLLGRRFSFFIQAWWGKLDSKACSRYRPNSRAISRGFSGVTDACGASIGL